jgi:hypothetical protein
MIFLILQATSVPWPDSFASKVRPHSPSPSSAAGVRASQPYVDRIDNEIKRITELQANRPKSPTFKQGQASFVRHVVQIRFNAWR